MGIRIKKVLGYGLETTEKELSAIVNTDVFRKRLSFTTSDYNTFLEGKYSKPNDETSVEEEMAYYLSDLCLGSWEEHKYTAYDLITVVTRPAEGKTETGSDDDIVSLLITPPLTYEKWNHHDDPIDYYEESLKYRNSEFQLETTMQFMDHSLFPFEGSYLNHATGETVKSEMVNLTRRYIHVTKDESTPEEDKALRLLLAGLKVSSVEEFQTLIHPAPPVSVLDIAEWTGLFHDSTVAQKLRPALLKYWD